MRVNTKPKNYAGGCMMDGDKNHSDHYRVVNVITNDTETIELRLCNRCISSLKGFYK